MQTSAPKQSDPQKLESSNLAQSHTATPALDHRADLLLYLQRTVGNQAVLQMLQTEAEASVAGLPGAASPRFARDLSRVPRQPPTPGAMQTKLTINKPGDVYEQEADRVSEQVMRMPEPPAQRSCSYGGACPPCQTEPLGQEHGRLQTTRVHASDTGQVVAPPIVREVLNSSGQPLAPETRSFMESRFGQDFRQVRIYTDARAAESARAVDALAYTVGQRIVFGAGQYAPQTSIGQQVLAHELTHTVQQDNNQLRCQPPPRIKISKPIVSTDAEQARRKGRELAELIKTGKWGPKNDEQLGHWLEFFEGSAWNAFLSELEDALGEKSPEGEGESKEHPEGAVTESSLLIPIAKPEVVRGGFKIAFFAQILEESSDSTSVEVYNDLSASAGVSVEIPIKKIAKFRFSAEAKTGRKETEKTEEKKTRRTGQTISRTFTVQKLEREGLKYEYLKIYHGVTPSRETLMLPKAQIAHRVTREGRGYNPREIQVGYQIVPEEGGKLWGPFWEVYEGSLPVKGSALTQVWKVISAEQRKIAEDLVFGGNN